jgi:large subunit ribosomal protein L15
MSMIHDITAGAPRNKLPKRKGRGESSGHGKTSGRGNKGAKARQGKYVKRGHEHGQTPIFRRLPKRGFSNENFENRFHVVNLSELDRFDDGATVDAAALIGAGLVPDDRLPVKILGDGALSKKLNVTAGWYSRSAHEKITGAGGAARNLKGEDFKFPKPTPRFNHKDQGKKKKAAVEAPAEGAAPAAVAPAAVAPAAAAPPPDGAKPAAE